MASVKICDIDGQVFIERAPGSISISNAAIYDENGRAIAFSGELCPECGGKVKATHKSVSILPPAIDYQDRENEND